MEMNLIVTYFAQFREDLHIVSNFKGVDRFDEIRKRKYDVIVDFGLT